MSRHAGSNTDMLECGNTGMLTCWNDDMLTSWNWWAEMMTFWKAGKLTHSRRMTNMLECWNAYMLEGYNAGIPECWHAGMLTCSYACWHPDKQNANMLDKLLKAGRLEYWNTDILPEMLEGWHAVCWNVEMLTYQYHAGMECYKFWHAGMLECWNGGMLTCWIVEMLECWHTDMQKCRNAEMLICCWHACMLTNWNADMLKCWHATRMLTYDENMEYGNDGTMECCWKALHDGMVELLLGGCGMISCNKVQPMLFLHCDGMLKMQKMPWME